VVQYTLSAATDADSDFIYNLKKVAYKEYIEQTWGWDEDFQLKFHKENFSTENTKIIKIDNVAIGTVDVKEEEQRIFLSGLYLFPEYQNKGIGTAIITDIEKKAKETGKRIELEVLHVNKKARELYKRLGFTLTEGDDTKYLMYKDY
jgi:ribosomal protein S18 acetylase RimI-like enzyme